MRQGGETFPKVWLALSVQDLSDHDGHRTQMVAVWARYSVWTSTCSETILWEGVVTKREDVTVGFAFAAVCAAWARCAWGLWWLGAGGGGQPVIHSQAQRTPGVSRFNLNQL
jgi:hypothetical protein